MPIRTKYVALARTIADGLTWSTSPKNSAAEARETVEMSRSKVLDLKVFTYEEEPKFVMKYMFLVRDERRPGNWRPYTFLFDTPEEARRGMSNLPVDTRGPFGLLMAEDD